MPEPTEVEVRVGQGGVITPIRFRWQGVWLQIAQIGRHWSDEAGDHWLVLPDRPAQVFELIRSPEERWQIKSSGPLQNIV